MANDTVKCTTCKRAAGADRTALRDLGWREIRGRWFCNLHVPDAAPSDRARRMYNPGGGGGERR